MSTLQHINSVVNYNWPELSRKYPGFEKPQIVPAETLRGLAPTYLRSAIDQDPTSMYMFIAGDPTKGDCSREVACRFFDELFYEKLQMPSSYEANEGYTREEAIDKEVLPPATDRQFMSFYDEQMAKVNAEQERQRRIDNLGFDPDDPDIIDVVDGEATIDGQSVNTSRAVGQAQTTAVGMPKKIFYCVDFHCPAGGMLGYSGGGRVGGGRDGRRFLREADACTPVSDILRAYNWAKTTGRLTTDGLRAIAKCSPASDANARNAQLHDEFSLYVFKYDDGRTTWVEEPASRPGDFRATFKDINDAAHAHWSRTYQTLEATVVTIDELRRMTTIAEEKEESDPEKMMKEFVEKKENGEVEEDEYRRPKNQPHNLHRTDESESGDPFDDPDAAEEQAYVVADLLEKTQKSDEDQLVYDKVKAFAVEREGTDDMDEHGAIDVVYELMQFVPSEKTNDAQTFADAIFDLVKKCPAASQAEYENWLERLENSKSLNESFVRFCDRLIRG